MSASSPSLALSAALLQPVRPSLALMGLAGLAITTTAQARDEKVVGVRAWTNGSQTYIRTRPSTSTPPVAKVGRHTPLFVWGKFNGWYRVETHDHILGWVHNEYINSPEIYKVRELSHYKARLASDQSSQQTMYGTPAELKAYYARYGGSGALKGLKQHGISLVKAPIARPKAKPKVYIAARPAPAIAVAPAPVIRPKTRRPAPAQPTRSAPVESANTPIIGESATLPATQPQIPAVQHPSQPPVIAPTPVPELGAPNAPSPNAPSRVSELGSGMLAKLPESKAPGSLLSSKPPVTAPPARVVAPAPRNSPLGGAPAPLRAVVPVLKAPTTKPIPAAVRAAQVKAARARWMASQAAAAKAARIARWKNDQAWKQKQHEKRLAAIQANRRLRLASGAKKREMLAAHVGLIPKGRPPVTLKSGQVAPLSPEELMKARDAFLANRNRKWTPGEGSLAPVGRVAPLPDASSPASSAGGPLAPATPGQIGPTAYSQGSAAPRAFLLGGTSSVMASRAGNRNRLVLSGPNRGGSPRDRYAAMGAANQKMALQALSYRGMPYIFGAASPRRGFDCSGLVFFLLRRRGYNPPRTAAGYRNYGVGVARGQWQPGDLILFANTYKRGISHIGIYLGNNKFVHAATAGSGVRVDSLNSGYYAAKYWGARRVK